MSKPQQASDTFLSGFNCAQSILSTFSSELFIDKKYALKLASPFGSGIAYRGEMCGAVTGALMVIGLNFGFDQAKDMDGRELMRAVSEEFLDVFEKKHGSVQCKKLLGADVTIPEELIRAREQGVFHKVCPAYIISSAEILEELIEKYKDLVKQ
jgi:C_GCAxxG_C_C family probable redox protein